MSALTFITAPSASDDATRAQTLQITTIYEHDVAGAADALVVLLRPVRPDPPPTDKATDPGDQPGSEKGGR
jgi:hypothetical protein